MPGFKIKKPTRKDIILGLIKNRYPKISCADLVCVLTQRENLKGNTAYYLSGSVSSILAKMVKDGILEYGEGKGPRGGHLYQLKTKDGIQKENNL